MLRLWSLIFVLTVVASGCGKLPGYMVNEKSDDFTQAGVINDKVDILFIVDNSGSMSNNQTTLAASFDTFIENFSQRNLNFQLGVISTDTHGVNWTSPTNFSFDNSSAGSGLVVYNDYWANNWPAAWYVGGVSPFTGRTQSGAGTLIAKGTNPAIITPSTANYSQKFQENVQLGVNGTGAERGLVSAMLAMNAINTGSGKRNNGFFRPDAFLAVILVSDEDEGTTNYWSGNYLRQSGQAAVDNRVNQFVSVMQGMKSDSSRVRFDAIVDQAGAGTCGGNGDGLTYIQAAAALNGRNIDICNNFGTEMADLGADILEAVTRFQLRQTPCCGLSVYVDGVQVPENSTNGFSYLSATNEIQFHGSAVPSVGQRISVVYTPASAL